jgi:hypothetical protein
VKTADPWESIPPEKRLDFEVIREPIETAATIINVERSLPQRIKNVVGAPPLLLLLTKVAEATLSTIRYFCAEKPEDPARRVSFASSAAPVVRGLLDEIYTVVFLGEDVPVRVQWYNKAGWREMREEYDRHLQRYKGKSSEWDAWLDEYRQKSDANQTIFGITA